MPPAASVPLDLYPPVSHDPRWWWLVAGCLLAAVAAMWGCRRVLAEIDSAAAGDGPVTLETVRAAALQDLEEAKDVSERGESDRAVCRRISIALRRFVGIVCDNDLDYEGLDDLSRRADEDARLKPVVEVVKRCYQVEFDPSGHDVDPDELVSMAVRTVRSWS